MRYHLSLHVQDLAASVAFFSRVFSAAPQKQSEGYAKFDLYDPPINLALLAAGEKPVTRVSHMGVEVDSPEALNQWRERLDKVGITTTEEQNSTCCFARQDKLWFSDPDGNPWEIFTVYEQLPVPEGAKGCGVAAAATPADEKSAPTACCG